MSASKLGRSSMWAWFFLAGVVMGLIVGGSASTKCAKVEITPLVGDGPWQILDLWPPQSEGVADLVFVT